MLMNKFNASVNSAIFMSGVIELPNVWKYADEAKELIENGCYNYCMICGQHISTYKQICHECEVKYNINWGDSITQKVQEYIQNIERGENNDAK